MPAPRMFSTTGSALTADEMSFAWRVFASFSVDMKRGWVKVIRRQDTVTSTIVEYHADKDIAYVTPGGAVDYVPMAMPNPVPYRGVSIEALVRNRPYIKTNPADTTPWAWDQIAYVRDIGDTASGGFSSTGVVGAHWYHSYGGIANTFGPYPSPPGYIFGTNSDGVIDVYPHVAAFDSFGYPGYTGDVNAANLEAAWSAANNTMENRTYVMASDGVVLASEVQNTTDGHVYYVPDTIWNGEGYCNMYIDSVTQPVNHQITFTVPEDCIYPIPATASTIFNTRRKAWFKKNSDEFIAALKTGFAAGTAGVTRSELQLGGLPEAWEFQIKLDVDVQYDSYTPTNTVGRKTKRDILYSEVAYSETVMSDTSANLTQAGVKVTTRSATLQYSFGGVVRETTINGSLTQTVTRHNNSSGAQIALSRNDVYSNWYNRESTSLPTGVPSMITAPYLKDRTTSRIGVVLNGVMQTGNNADSSLGSPGNPLTFAGATPPYPAAYRTVTATAPAWIEEWHADTKILYAADGSGASNTQNDSALHGVTKIELTPVGLIANGVGTAAAGEPVGMFSAAEDGTQVEIYGTAIYNFDWQTGSLTFANWKPLHGDNGLEVASKIVDLPQGVLWGDNPTNCLVTYRGLHWPDVVAAIRVRDSALPTSGVDFDRVLYTLIQAVKAG